MPPGQSSIPNTSEWTASGGAWQVLTATGTTVPSGSNDVAVQGTTSTPFQILKSTYTTGSSYVLDAYGETDLGPGLGARGRAQSNNTFDSINLYDDLNSTNNLYAYKWTSGSSTTIANAAVGTVNSGQWYELTAKVNGPSISVYLNNNLELQGSDSALQPGSIALYGEGGVEQFANVFVRQYAPTDPTVTVSPAAAGTPQSISFTSTPPTSAAVGGTPYTVTATGGGIRQPGRVQYRLLGVLRVLDLRLDRELHRSRHMHHRCQPGRQQHLQPSSTGPAVSLGRCGHQTVRLPGQPDHTRQQRRQPGVDELPSEGLAQLVQLQLLPGAVLGGGPALLRQ